jgi:hypothetical protein
MLKGNHEIEKLTDYVNTLDGVLGLDWTIKGDGWNDIYLATERKQVSIFKNPFADSITILLMNKEKLAFSQNMVVFDDIAEFMLMPMIENFMLGSRAEITEALNPLFQISPAIN